MGTVIHTAMFAKASALKANQDKETAIDSFKRVIDKLENRVSYSVFADEIKATFQLFKANGWVMYVSEMVYKENGNLGHAEILVTHEQLQAILGC